MKTSIQFTPGSQKADINLLWKPSENRKQQSMELGIL